LKNNCYYNIKLISYFIRKKKNKKRKKFKKKFKKRNPITDLSCIRLHEHLHTRANISSFFSFFSMPSKDCEGVPSPITIVGHVPDIPHTRSYSFETWPGCRPGLIIGSWNIVDCYSVSPHCFFIQVFFVMIFSKLFLLILFFNTKMIENLVL